MIVTKPYTFSAGATIIAAEHNSNFDTLYNLVNGSIDNSNISGSAAIVDTKLNTISTAQKVNTSSLFTTSQSVGDILYGDTTNSYTRRAIGNSLQFLAGGTTPNYRGLNVNDVPQIGTLSFLTGGTNGLFLQTQGAGTVPRWAVGRVVEMFTTSGTWTCPGGVNYIEATIIGGGGAGGGTSAFGGGGGGASQTIYAICKVTPASTYAVTIGAGGAGVASGTGNNGGTSSFVHDNGTITCVGGLGGTQDNVGGAATQSVTAFLTGGTNSGTTGGAGGRPFAIFGGGAGGARDDTSGGGGGGGASYYGFGGAGGNNNGNGSVGSLGAGGGGAGHTGTSGAGGSGAVILIYNVNGAPV